MRSASNVTPIARAKVRRDRDELAFLPAALEIVETPPSPIGRAIVVSTVLLVLAVVAWSALSQVDIIATAPGKIVPTGRIKVIQPLEPGIVAAIRVQDGDYVSAGQVLIELDRTLATAESNRIKHDLTRSQLDVARLSALRYALANESEPVSLEAPAEASESELERTRAAMVAQAAEHAAKLASIEQQVAQKTAEADSVAAMVAKLESSLPLVEQEADIRQKAAAIGFGNQIANLEAQERVVEQKHELRVQQQHAIEIAAAREALEWQRKQAKAEYTRVILTDLADAQQKVAELTEDAAKASEKMAERLMIAPIDGTVQQLVVHTIGGVVTPAQQLMVIVPSDSHLEAEAMISNRDIGFVRVGDSAAIKVDTFNFTRYGLLHGVVQGISQDAIVRERLPDVKSGGAAGTIAGSSEQQGQELMYAARVSLDTTRMRVEDKMVSLLPGMALTVEIKTGSRSILNYLLSPLLRMGHESLRER